MNGKRIDEGAIQIWKDIEGSLFIDFRNINCSATNFVFQNLLEIYQNFGGINFGDSIVLKTKFLVMDFESPRSHYLEIFDDEHFKIADIEFECM